jgi:5-formyltetrahydrofolate cyclo-ligase
MSKERIRQTIRSLLKTLPPRVFREEGIQALARIQKSSLWDFHRILFFLSTDREIDTFPLMEAAFAGKKEVYVPQIKGEELGFYRIYSPAGPWREGAFGIREPENPEKGDALKEGEGAFLVLVPGLAFDLRGGRMGHGKGYYDRFFAGLDARRGKTRGAKKNYTALGLCLDAQIISQVPMESQDKVMDALCTGTFLWEGPGWFEKLSR